MRDRRTYRGARRNAARYLKQPWPGCFITSFAMAVQIGKKYPYSSTRQNSREQRKNERSFLAQLKALRPF